MADEDRITDPLEIVAYVASARGLYALDQDLSAIEISDR